MTQGFPFWVHIQRVQKTNLKEYMHPSVHCSTIYLNTVRGQDTEATRVPINRHVDNKAAAHVHNGLLLGYRKEQNLTHCNSMDGPRGHHAT